MNENLKELAKQTLVEHCISHVRLQAFAEVIVLRCIELNKQKLSFTAFERLANDYYEHFGINHEQLPRNHFANTTSVQEVSQSTS